jgi:hypothetical protein
MIILTLIITTFAVLNLLTKLSYIMKIAVVGATGMVGEVMLKWQKEIFLLQN